MKASDILAKFLKKNNVRNVFGLQGGAVAHIFDSIEKEKIKVTYTHHEQCASLAAVSYSKVSGNVGCVVVTTGPGSTNAITGLLAAWQDSIPCIFISGQARSDHVSYNKKVRQVGTQEVNICDIVKPITKYTKFLKNKKNFYQEICKAYKIAKSGRPGPVWLDFALELQWSDIDLKKNIIKKIDIDKTKNFVSDKENSFLSLCNKSKRPLLILGYGLRLSDFNLVSLKNFVKKQKIPFVLTWNSADFYPTNHPLNLGIIGMSGQRGANKSIFDSDLLICLGTHLSIPHTTTLYKNFAPNSKKVIINIDKNQMKNLNVKFDLKVKSDVTSFLKNINKYKICPKISWTNLENYKKKNWYNIKKNKKINSNIFIREFTSHMKKNSCIVIDGGGTALYAGFQSSIFLPNQRVICSSSISSMGTGLAESLGAYASGKFEQITCIIGDGSFFMNIQDLQNIIKDKINIKIILVNNNGYLAIRNTQKEFLQKRYYGTNPEGGLTMPKFKDCNKFFDLKYFSINSNRNLKKNIHKILKIKGPVLCELFIDEDQPSLFKQGYKKNKNNMFEPQPLSEMYPFFENPISNTNN
jgi:acetolactate synthase-1/2/3 large subunit